MNAGVLQRSRDSSLFVNVCRKFLRNIVGGVVRLRVLLRRAGLRKNKDDDAQHKDADGGQADFVRQQRCLHLFTLKRTINVFLPPIVSQNAAGNYDKAQCVERYLAHRRARLASHLRKNGVDKTNEANNNGDEGDYLNELRRAALGRVEAQVRHTHLKLLQTQEQKCEDRQGYKQHRRWERQRTKTGGTVDEDEQRGNQTAGAKEQRQCEENVLDAERAEDFDDGLRLHRLIERRCRRWC